MFSRELAFAGNSFFMNHALSLAIDKTSAVPIYFQLQRAIAGLIESGLLKPGDSLPSENELARQYSISTMTVRQAMGELVSGGYVHRERGRGTFISTRRMGHSLDRMVGFSEDMQSRQLNPSSVMLLLETAPPPPDVIARIDLPPETSLLRLKRVRFANGDSVGIHDSYLYQVPVTLDDLRHTKSLYALLQQRGVSLTEAEDAIDAVSASPDEAALLHINPGDPMLRTTRFSWDQQGSFVEYVVALYRADLYQYRIRLRR
jgi:GntR family transcriptional regulator